jgi:putative ABC transport system permease protein
MNLATIYNIFIRDFRKQKKRITLTLVALGWGTISIMLLLGFGEGLHQQLSINRKGMGEGIVILWAGSTSLPYKGLPKGRELHFTADDIDYLKASMPELAEVGGEYSRWGVEVRYGNSVVSEHVTGITPNYETMRNHIPEMGSRMINELDMQQKRRVAFLGDELKNRLFGDEEAIGKQIFIRGLPFTVIGVMQHKMQMSSYSGHDLDKVSIPLTTFEAVFGHRYLNNIIYVPTDLNNMAAIERRIYEVFSAKMRFDPDDDRAISVWDTVDSSREFNNILVGVKLFLGIIGGLTLLIAGVGVANIMYVSIKERTREIGIKMAVGGRKSYILFQFLIEAFIITFVGGFGGMAVSYILTEGFQRIPIAHHFARDRAGRYRYSRHHGFGVGVVSGHESSLGQPGGVFAL